MEEDPQEETGDTMQTLALWAIALALFAVALSIANQPSYKQEALFISVSLDKIADALKR